MRTRRSALAGLVLATLALALLVSPASAAKPCAQQVIDDWIADAQVDGTYELHCYREAIAALPEDAAVYSSAADDIQRALQERIRDEQSSGGSGGTGSGDGGGGSDPAGGGSGESSGGGSSGAGSGSGSAGGGSSGGGGAETPSGGEEAPGGDSGQEGLPTDGGGPVAAPDEGLFEEGLGDGSGGLPTPLLVVLAAAGILAGAAALKLALGQRARPRGGSPSSPGPDPGS